MRRRRRTKSLVTSATRRFSWSPNISSQVAVAPSRRSIVSSYFSWLRASFFASTLSLDRMSPSFCT